jgi:hypothetical protein
LICQTIAEIWRVSFPVATALCSLSSWLLQQPQIGNQTLNWFNLEQARIFSMHQRVLRLCILP